MSVTCWFKVLSFSWTKKNYLHLIFLFCKDSSFIIRSFHVKKYTKIPSRRSPFLCLPPLIHTCMVYYIHRVHHWKTSTNSVPDRDTGSNTTISTSEIEFLAVWPPTELFICNVRLWCKYAVSQYGCLSIFQYNVLRLILAVVSIVVVMNENRYEWLRFLK